MPKGIYKRTKPAWNKGKKHPQLTGENINWRKSVFKRDNYTCQICDNGCRELNAHHIYSWQDFPSLRYEEWNGSTLCKTCHNWVHSSKNINQIYMENN